MEKFVIQGGVPLKGKIRIPGAKNSALPLMPDTIKKKIFHPFFTTKGPRASGLGLSVSYGIIKRHQGKIKVESTEGKGTTFIISIPVRLEAKKR